MNTQDRRYKYYDAGNKIIAVSSYAGKSVRGVAICHPNDKFDLEKGINLATARCNEKIAKKRFNRAMSKVAEAQRILEEATRYHARMMRYLDDSTDALNEAIVNVTELEYSM